MAQGKKAGAGGTADGGVGGGGAAAAARSPTPMAELRPLKAAGSSRDSRVAHGMLNNPIGGDGGAPVGKRLVWHRRAAA